MKFFKLFALTLLLTITSCSKKDEVKSTIAYPNGEEIAIDQLKTDIGGLSDVSATIKTIHGDIIFRFYTKAAPKTSARIMHLIQAKFYDDLIFHRALPNFVIQTGDPTGTGTGGSGATLPPEFSKLQHIKGTLGMARGRDVDSADSQFYISLTTLPHLDGQQTVFGQVVDGLEILSKLSKGDKIISITLNLNDKGIK